ncbi:glycosyltransferase family protein [Pseudodesulfovibrio pelocollis]|uniref:glycosyltransferase family protein n=1 Tax=Pseudodesulfovibrio pelocollis TaxID=3051432 RepID=UPI00255B2B08|nr:glycosyltransferase [Pseudodesulfovibrio sp. SB368]
MRVLFYCQHVLGVGHVFRSLEIVRALAGHEVVMVTGGAEIDFDPPANMVHERLPGLMMSPDFKSFIPSEPAADLDEVRARRIERFRAIMARYRPDVLLIELFPFGRRAFRFELLPILEGVRAGEWGPCKTACSLRDILVEKPDPAKYARRVLDMLNPHFDLVLVHADPTLITLDETFPAVADIVPPLRYTGYVAARPEPGAGRALRRELGLDSTPLIIASAGGGQVGNELIQASIQSSILLADTLPHALMAFTGPYAPKADHARCQTLAADHPHITVRRFTSRFPAHLDAADLSLSLGGYNTTMNLLAANTFGLILPFTQNREQTMRTSRLEKRGTVGLLNPADLDPARLATRIAQALTHPATPCPIDLTGATTTARYLEEVGGGSGVGVG